jgi:prolyl-tRNA synthetase
VGNIFKLGTRYSDALGCAYLDRDGKLKPIVMGSYGIGSGRLLACIAEEYHDERGLTWPISVAPYQVHLVALKGGEEMAEQLNVDLQAAGLELLYDDRDESPGVKFNDADLIGVPLRITVGERSLKAGGVELKLRTRDERVLLPRDDVLPRLQREIAALEAEIRERVVEVPYKA